MRIVIKLIILCVIAVSIATQGFCVERNPQWRSALKPKGVSAEMLTLAVRGVTSYRIVIPASPNTKEIKAADDLALWLGEMTRAKFAIVRESGTFTPTGREISVGRTLLFAKADTGIDIKKLRLDGYGVAVKGSTLFIVGGTRRGIINGVYCLLEEDLNCRWYAINTTSIPHVPTLKFRPVQRTYNPKLETMRDIYYCDALQTDFSIRNKTFALYGYVPEEWGGFLSLPFPHVHTYFKWVPPEKYFAEHPEYFSLNKGVRVAHQLCITNPDVQRIIMSEVRNYLKENPNTKIIDVSPYDGWDYCECPECTKAVQTEASQMGPLMKVVNDVADMVKKEFPNTLVSTLAYKDTVVVPKYIRPRDNVVIWLCTDAHSPHRLNYVWETKVTADAIKAWGKIGAKSIVWDYPVEFNFLEPNINLAVLADNIRFYVNNGASGVFLQSADDDNTAADHSYARSWISSKLLWDQSLDTKKLLKDFNYGFYGKAAPQLQQYDQLLWDSWLNYRKDMKKKDYPGPKIWGILPKSWSLMEEAQQIASDDPELIRRVRVAQLPVLYKLGCMGPGTDMKTYLARIDYFEKTAKEMKFHLVDAFGVRDIDTLCTSWRRHAQLDLSRLGVMTLPSAWKCSSDPSNIGKDQNWFKSDFNDSTWKDVRVDLNKGWEEQGFPDYDGFGWYRTSFNVTGDTLKQPGLRMFFGAVDEEAEIWINGRKACDHTIASTGRTVESLWDEPFLFDPIPYLVEGNNTIAVRVHDMLHQGGIWRPVYLVWGELVSDTRELYSLVERKTAK